METQNNNIDKHFRKLSEEAQPKTFQNMENIWNKVEEKLDQKDKKRVFPIWKYAGIAASLLLLIGLGSRFIGSDPVNIIQQPKQKIVIEEEIKEELNTISDTEMISSEDEKPENEKPVIYAPPVIESIEIVSEETEIEEVEITVSDIENESLVVAKESELEVNADTIIQADSVSESGFAVTEEYNQTVYKAIVNKISERENAEKTITGTVTDEYGLPLPGVNIIIKNSSIGTQTDFDGKYSINTQKEETLVFSYVGYETQEIKIGDSNRIDVYLKEDNSALNEVVVTAYGRSKRKKVKTASIVSVEAEEFQSMPLPTYNLTQQFQGQTAGVQIQSDYEGNVVGDNIRIIGNNSIQPSNEPLYVLDGKPVSKEIFQKINPKDIGAISVLKDRNAIAIYGNRGAKGVIVIQSKKELKKQGEIIGDTIRFEDIHTMFPPVEIGTESYESFIENQFESASYNPVSTFSIDVDNASYTNIRRFINNGQKVPKDAVRIEEMINFFKYDYPQPKSEHPFSIHTEYSDAPWNPNHKLLKVGLKGKDIPIDKLPKSNFVFLVDVSGSMNSPNKLPLLKSSMKILMDELRDDDRVSIVYYANNVGVLLEPTKASEKQKINAIIDKMYASGGTSGGAGLELAYQLAEKHFIKGGNNRIILATDGDFNIGKSSDKEMQDLIEEKRKSGIFLTCLGFGMGNYKDSKMEILANKGNGNYAYIDNIQEANRFLSKEFKGSMFTIAKDVKIQIEFNPNHVQAYRLIGYENRKLRNEDFTNDTVDAGELGSGHTVTALYEIIPTGVKSDFYKDETELKYTKTTTVSNDYQNELATLKFRYKKPDRVKSTEMVHPISKKPVPFSVASKDFKFSSAVAWFGLKLRDSKLILNKQTKEILKLAKEGVNNDTDGYKAEFIRLVESVK